MLAFAATIFAGAFLLFQVQPLIGKFILPWFGGSPAVWTTCMLFFQIVLLGGYAYAHWLTTWVKPQKQAALHCLFLLAAVSVLPIIPSDQWKPEPGTEPTGHILVLLLSTIGLPYFVLSTTGPLIQKWFSWLHPGKSPYRLYALSNIGSLLALLSYPFVIEPLLSRKQQAAIWSLGLFIFVGACGWCAYRLWLWGKDKDTPIKNLEGTDDAAAVSTPLGRQLLWLLLPACASALLLATTNKLCQDVAVVPFLWILPLSVYLLTFILCFESDIWYRRRIFYPLYIAGIPAVTWIIANIDDVGMVWQVTGFMSLLFACCMICHGELHRLRPHPRQLTRFYLMISLGGALGGLFVAVGAPNIWLTYVEFHWTLAVTALLAWIVCLPDSRAATFKFWHFKLWLCGALTVMALGICLYQSGHEEGDNVVERVRNFYGSMFVAEYISDDDTDTPYMLLQHGRITHGFQVETEDQRDLATTYYGDNSGVGLAMFFTAKRMPRRVAVVGLGTGTLASYGQATDTFRFYEINPEVKRFAEEHFQYLGRSAAKIEFAIGDARLNMEREEPQNYDVIALDAFSSDAIPVHLLTREAFEVYARHLRPDGLLAIHISNRYIDLQPVVLNAAREFGYHHVTVDDDNPLDEWWIYSSTWVILGKDEQLVDAVRQGMLAPEEEPSDTELPLWTDDYTSLFPIVHDGS
jgi:SAM-dependent methyltransferase